MNGPVTFHVTGLSVQTDGGPDSWTVSPTNTVVMCKAQLKALKHGQPGPSISSPGPAIFPLQHCNKRCYRAPQVNHFVLGCTALSMVRVEEHNWVSIVYRHVAGTLRMARGAADLETGVAPTRRNL